MRQNSEDYKVPNHNLIIPKDCLTIIPVHAIHRDPDIYPEPDRFDPERFSEENKMKRSAVSFLAFGDGSPKNCIGVSIFE